MGSFTHNCKLSGLPISGSAALIVMKPKGNLYDCSEESLKKYGKTYMCSNDNTRLKYLPVWPPIFGEYDTYGGLENIIEDDNTKAIENYYELSIDEILGIICSGRKDDGYDDSLTKIKKPFIYPEGWQKGDTNHTYYERIMNDKIPFGSVYATPRENNGKYQVFNNKNNLVKGTKEVYDEQIKLIQDWSIRYNEWVKNNPDPTDDYNNPQYEDKYKELLTYSGMWVHGDFYRQLVSKRKTEKLDYFDKLDIGTPELLESLGFTEGKKIKADRYNITFIQGPVTLYSDGTWVEQKDCKELYSLQSLKKYCKKKGLDIDISKYDNMGKVEQSLRLIAKNIVLNKPKKLTSKEIAEKDEKLKNEYENNDRIKEIFSYEQYISLMNADGMNFGREESDILYYLLNGNYSEYKVKNELVYDYLELVKQGKLIEDFADFWYFNRCMFSMGAFYEIVGTAPQDGDRKQVKLILQTALDVLNAEIDEYEDEDEDEDN